VREDRDEGRAEPPVPSEVDAEGIGRSGLGALGAEQVIEPMVESGDRQQNGDSEGPDDLEIDADLRDAAEKVDTADVERQLDENQHDREEEDLVGIGGIEIGVEEVVQQRAGVDHEARID